MAKTIILPIAKGTEELEAITILNILRRAEINVVLYSDNDIVQCARGTKIIPDTKDLNSLYIDEIEGVILPGGVEGVNNLSNNEVLIEFIKECRDKNKLIGAICAAPQLLEFHKIFPENIRLTSHPSIMHKLTSYEYLEDEVVIDKNFITSRGVGTALNFAFAIVEYLLNADTSLKIKNDIVYKS